MMTPLADYLRTLADSVEPRSMTVDTSRAPRGWRAQEAPSVTGNPDAAKLAADLVSVLDAMGDTQAIAKAIVATLGPDAASKLVAASGKRNRLEDVESEMRRAEAATLRAPATEQERTMRAEMDRRMALPARTMVADVQRQGRTVVFGLRGAR